MYSDVYSIECLLEMHQREALASAARERLAATLRRARQPLQVRAGFALIRLGAWLLGLTPEEAAKLWRLGHLRQMPAPR
jgi:hypothetical protein